MPMADQHLGGRTPAALHTTPETARSTLSALCSAMFTVTGVVFSTTIVALSITSAQLGPRLLRNFLRQKTPQLALACCLASSVYCLLLLRSVDQVDDSIFVPHLSVTLAGILGVATLIVIVFYIHTVAHSMQAQNVVSDVADDLDDAIQRLFPKSLHAEGGSDDHDADGDEPQQSSAASQGAEPWLAAWESLDDLDKQTVLSHGDGYVQAIDEPGLSAAAARGDGVIRILARPGDYVREGEPLAEICRRDGFDDDDDHSQLASSFILGNSRTTQQDVECAINELAEIALRALSPGVNDPFTAVACIDRLSGTLRRLACREMPSGLVRDDEGNVRIVVRPRRFERILAAAFNQIRQSATGNVAVQIRLLDALKAIGVAADRRADRVAVLRQAEIIQRAAVADQLGEADRADVLQAFGALEEAVTRRRDPAAVYAAAKSSHPDAGQAAATM